jgi:hypothetical protein
MAIYLYDSLLAGNITRKEEQTCMSILTLPYLT